MKKIGIGILFCFGLSPLAAAAHSGHLHDEKTTNTITLVGEIAEVLEYDLTGMTFQEAKAFLEIKLPEHIYEREMERRKELYVLAESLDIETEGISEETLYVTVKQVFEENAEVAFDD
jgi:hypothetical protein